MAIKPTIKPYLSGPVQEFVGTSYDVIKTVYDHLDMLKSIDFTVISELDSKIVYIEGLVETAEIYKNTANTYAIDAQNSAISSQNSANAAENSNLESQSYAATALLHKNDAESYKNQTYSYYTDVQTAKNAVDIAKASVDSTKIAIDSTKTDIDAIKLDIDASKTQVSTDKSVVLNTKTEVQTLKTQTETYRNDSESFYLNTVTYSNLAERWASELEDVPVVTGKYSSLHYATKASAASSSAEAHKNEALTHKNAAEAAALDAETVKNTVTTLHDEVITNAVQVAEDKTIVQQNKDIVTQAEQNVIALEQSATAAEANAVAANISAANHANVASTARDQTLAAFDSFDDRYLGAKLVEPTVDNDGQPLQVGALYFDENPPGIMKVYDGTAWRSAYASLEGALLSSNNLNDLTDAAAARANIGLGNVNNVSAANLRDRGTHTGTQALSTIDGLQVALDGKANLSHTHAISNITGLQTVLDSKSNNGHTHNINDVTGLQAALNTKLNSSEYTAEDVLAKIKTVDGSGSELDADMLDGLDSSGFIKRNDVTEYEVLSFGLAGTPTVGYKIKTNISVNNRMCKLKIEAGQDSYTNATVAYVYWYYYNGTIRDPRFISFAAGDTLDSFEIGVENGKFVLFINDPGYYTQFRICYLKYGLLQPSEAEMENWTWANEEKSLTPDAPYKTAIGGTCWHEGNDGAGSGMDSDLLDGQHGAYYLDWDNFTNTPTLNITNWNTAYSWGDHALAGYAPEIHTHDMSSINGLNTALLGKANTIHNHEWTEVNNKPATAMRWPLVSEVTGLESELNSKVGKEGDQTINGTLSVNKLKKSGYVWEGDVNGDFYVAINAYHDGVNWRRYNETKPAWLHQYNKTNNMIYEGYKAYTEWRCPPGANPITGFTTVGGWLMTSSMSEFGDYTLGGNGIEIDGHFTYPYGRLIHTTVGGFKYTGLLTNVFLDYSGRDDTNEHSVFAGFIDDGAGTINYKIQYSPEGAALSWVDLLTVDKNGNAYFTGTINGNGYGINNIVSANVVFDSSEVSLSSGNVQDALEELSNKVDDTSEQIGVLGTVLSTTNGTILTKTLTGNTTLSDALGAGESLTLMLDIATYTVTWPTIKWVGGEEPVLENPGYNVIVVWKVGGVLYGLFTGVA